MISELDPLAEVFYSKLTSPTERQRHSSGDEQTPSRWELSPINRALMQRRLDAERIFDTLPDMETIISVAVSSMLCTKDLVTSTLIYTCPVPENEIPLSVKENMLDVLREYFSNELKLPQKLYEWLYEAMSVAGAVPLLILPESSFDKMFQLRREGIAKSTTVPGLSSSLKSYLDNQEGYWGDPEGRPRLYTESYQKPERGTGAREVEIGVDGSKLEGKIILTDNIDFMKVKKNQRVALQRESFREKALSGLNSLASSYKDPGDVNKDKTAAAMGKRINPTYEDKPNSAPHLTIPTAKEAGRSKTHPSLQPYPSEAVIPVTIPGNELDPIGYLISHDMSGNPLSLRSVGSLDNALFTNTSGGSDLISSSARALGLTDNEVAPPIKKIMSKYGEMVEKKFLASLENGMLGEGVALGKNEEFYRVMYARHLAKRDTAVVYCPAEQLAYLAVDYDSNGIGRSLIDRSKVISTVRMVHLFATMNTMVQNSARNIQYEITVPEEERDPKTAIALAKSDIVRSHNSFQPVWGDVDDVYAQTANAGIVFKVIGNEFYPTANIEQTDITPDFKVPDKELDENFVRRICQLARVDPDLILQPENLEFASQIYSKSLISTKQIIMKQQGINKTVTNLVSNYTLSSGILLDKLVDAIKGADGYDPEHPELIPRYVRLLLEYLTVQIPPPDTSFTKSQMEQYDEKMTIVDKILEDTITDDVADAVGVDGSKLRAIIKSWYSIQWLRNNGVETELVDTILTETDHAAMVKDITDRHSTIGKLIAMVNKRLEGKLETIAKNYGSPDDGDGFGGGLGDDALTDDIGGDLGGDDDILSDDLEIDGESEDAEGPEEIDLDSDSDSTEEVEEDEDEDKGPEEIDLD